MLQGKQSFFIVVLTCIFSTSIFAQSDYIQLHNKQYQLLDRLDIKLRNDSVLGFTTMKPYNRESITERVEWLDSMDKAGILPFSLSKVDRYNIQHLLMANNEWTKYHKTVYNKKGLWNTFYKNTANMYEVHDKDFDMVINPVLNLNRGNASDGTGTTYVNTRGILIRGNIEKKIGFYSYFSDNQEITPQYIRQFEGKFSSIPGYGYYKREDKVYDYFDARGGITFKITKHIDGMFAYDKLFLGNGFRSLFLSDESAPYLFLKIKTRVWKFDYENVFAELTATHKRTGDYVRPKKYLTQHHLSYQVAKWLNLGFYENVMFGRPNGFELNYLNPVIFYRSIEQQLGSPDKATVGFDFKSNVTKSVQLYGQLVINEFVFSEIRNYKEGDWRNKHAAQIGLKYIDVAGIKNLDLQLEYNWLRPFVFTHRDSATSYTHYNQAIAHPKGANIKEVVAIVRYQPIPKLYINARVISYIHGLDPAGQNWGGNIFLSYNNRPQQRGFFVGEKIKEEVMLADFNASYELLDNIFADINATVRNYKVAGAASTNSTFINFGIRANLQRRSHTF